MKAVYVTLETRFLELVLGKPSDLTALSLPSGALGVASEAQNGHCARVSGKSFAPGSPALFAAASTR